MFEDIAEEYRYIEDNIIISSQELAVDKKFIEEHKIDVIINVSSERNFIQDDIFNLTNERFLAIKPINRKIDKYFFKLYDDESYLEDFVLTLPKVSDVINKNVLDNKKILIHCAAGINRSPTALAAYYILYKNMTPKEAVEYIRKRKYITFISHYLLVVLNLIYTRIGNVSI